MIMIKLVYELLLQVQTLKSITLPQHKIHNNTKLVYHSPQ